MFQKVDIYNIGLNLLIVFAIFICTFIVYQFSKRLYKILASKNLIPQAISKVLKTVTKIILFLSAFFITLQYLGISVTSIWALFTTLFAMIAIGFVALWSVISNALCTILLIVTKPFRIGDTIELTEAATPDKSLGGKVVNISMLYTIIREPKGSQYLIIPNSMFFLKIIRRYIGTDTVSLDEQLFKEVSLLPGEKKAGKNYL